MFHRVRNAGLTPQLLDSDHYAIFMKLRIMKQLKKDTQTRSRMLNLDYSILNNPQNEKELSPLIKARNEAMRNVLRKRTPLNTKRLQ